MIYNVLKRTADIIFSVILMFALIPVWIIVPILIKADSPGRVFFSQKRIGIESKYFTIFKFRTMKEGTPDIPTDRLENQAEMNTIIGTFLRRYSIDELPQLLNILKGEMSFVGPRPALYNQPKLIELRKQRGIDRIRPGVTGLAQVCGRDSLSIAEKVKYDGLYLKDMSFWLDFKILLVTVKATLTNRGGN